MNRGSGRVQAVTVRLYSPVSGEWSIYWATDNNPGRLDVPMVGKFDGGRGEFSRRSCSKAGIFSDGSFGP